MSDLPVDPPPEHPNDYARAVQAAAGIREVPSKEKTRPLLGERGVNQPPKRRDYRGR